MHTRIVLTVFLILLVAAISASADTIYKWSFGPEPRGGFGIQSGSLDSFDSRDWLASPAYGWKAGAYHVKGQDGWDGSMGFYVSDIRAPLTVGETKTWTIYFWAVPGASPGDRGISWYETPLPSNMTAKLEYIQVPPGVYGGPIVGTVWTSPPSFTLPFYTTTDGLTGYGFKFTLTMVPEPSSLAALCVGLVPLLIRRRHG
jgi:hypothetical protein